MSNFDQNRPKPPGFHHAIKVVRSSPSAKLTGVQADLSAHNPSVSNQQFSAGGVYIQSMTEAINQTDSIQTGWTVQPSLPGDTQTHAYAKWTDSNTGDWCLQYNFEKLMGCWPKQLFTGLQSSNREIAWGGAVYSESSPSPAMGSGRFAVEGWGYAAFVANHAYMDESHNLRFAYEKDLEAYSDTPMCYRLAPYMDFGFFYGGPGRNCRT
ncbi:hypothetical protein AB3S75_005738 [Citrus x aurantiifolia]